MSVSFGYFTYPFWQELADFASILRVEGYSAVDMIAPLGPHLSLSSTLETQCLHIARHKAMSAISGEDLSALLGADDGTDLPTPIMTEIDQKRSSSEMLQPNEYNVVAYINWCKCLNLTLTSTSFSNCVRYYFYCHSTNPSISLDDGNLSETLTSALTSRDQTTNVTDSI